jgi:hypothetical protein
MSFLTTQDLAQRWRMNPGTLSNWRIAGRGPRWFKLGEGQSSKVLYRLADVEAYEQEAMGEKKGTPTTSGV